MQVPAQGAAVTNAAEAADDGASKTIAGRVVKASKAAPGTGVVVVDVATSAKDGPTAAAWVSTRAVRLVLDAPEGRCWQSSR
ncbi:SAF domain-containing protein OS=Streptomyces griseomycini OX=66895 GN=FHS37_007373 PE=4 SV=1 [Streptomyces griseomycini]